MKTSRTTVVVIALVSALVFGASGLIGGYILGYLDGDGLNAPSEAAVPASALRAHRKGDTESAVSLLESTLDSTLMERWSYDQRSHPLAGLVGDGQVKSKVMGIAADYRAEVQSTAPDENVRAAIGEVVTRYKSEK